MDINIKKDQERVVELENKQKLIIDRAESDGRKFLNESEEKEFDALHTEAVAIQRNIDRKVELNKKQEERANLFDEIASDKKESREKVEVDANKLNKAYLRSMIVGKDELTTEEREILTRAQSTTATAGGNFIPTDLFNRITVAMDKWGGMRENSYVFKTSGGNNLDFPYVNDTAGTVELISEGSAITANDDWAESKVTLGSYKYGQAVLINWELAQDSDWDVVQFTIDRFAERFGRGLNAKYTTGTGSSQPNGVMTATSAGVTLAAQTAITYNEVLDLKHSVDPAYRFNGKFMMNDDTLLVLKKLSVGSSDARPLWQPGMAAGEPGTIDGSQYFINQDCDSLGSLKKVMAYGDFSQFYIRDCGDFRIKRDDSLKVLEDQIVLVGWWRTDCDLVDTRAIKHMATLTNT